MKTKSSQPEVSIILTYARKIAAAIVLAAFTAYGLASYVWYIDQPIGACVIATMGYLLFRSLRKIVFNLTWQKFSSQLKLASIVDKLNDGWLLKKEADVLIYLNQTDHKESPHE